MQWGLDVIDRQLQQMTRLIDDLLDISRITRNTLDLRKERLDLAEVLQVAVETSRPLIEEGGQEFVVTLPPEPIHLDADPIRLAQVISNLLNNAAKYTERGGHIWLTAEQHGQRCRRDGAGHRHRHPRRACCPASSRCSRRWIGRWSARRAGWASA